MSRGTVAARRLRSNHIQQRIILDSGMAERLRAFRYLIFTAGNTSFYWRFRENGLLHKVSGLALSVTCGDTSPKGRGLGKEMKFAWTAKGSPFGRAGIERSEMTERARSFSYVMQSM